MTNGRGGAEVRSRRDPRASGSATVSAAHSRRQWRQRTQRTRKTAPGVVRLRFHFRLSGAQVLLMNWSNSSFWRHCSY